MRGQRGIDVVVVLLFFVCESFDCFPPICLHCLDASLHRPSQSMPDDQLDHATTRPTYRTWTNRMLQRLCWYGSLVLLLNGLMQTRHLCFAADNEDFMDHKIEALGTTARLNCNSTESNQAKDIPELYEPIAWMLPNLSRVIESDGYKYALEENNWTLVVNDTELEDLGVYHCMLLNISHTGSYYLVKVGLNAEGPYFFDMWDKYMWPTIIGICSFFGFLLLAAIAVILYHFRYERPEEEEEEKEEEKEKEIGDERERDEGGSVDGDAAKVDRLTDDGTTASLPPYNGNAPSHTYENPSFLGDAHPYEVESQSDDEDLTSL